MRIGGRTDNDFPIAGECQCVGRFQVVAEFNSGSFGAGGEKSRIARWSNSSGLSGFMKPPAATSLPSAAKAADARLVVRGSCRYSLV